MPVLLKKKNLYFVFLVFGISNSHGNENNVLQDCRERVHARLIQNDQIFRALATKMSDAYPRECVIEYKNLKRFEAIEGNEYFADTFSDDHYRALTKASLNHINAQQLTDSMYTNLSARGPNPKIENQNRTQIEFVEGYGILKGSK